MTKSTTLAKNSARLAKTAADSLPSSAALNRHTRTALAIPSRTLKHWASATLHLPIRALKHSAWMLLPAPIRAMNRWTWAALLLISFAAIWALGGVLTRSALLAALLCLFLSFLWSKISTTSAWLRAGLAILAALTILTFGIWLGQQNFLPLITLPNFLNPQ